MDDGCGHAEGFLQALLLFQLGREGGESESVLNPQKAAQGAPSRTEG